MESDREKEGKKKRCKTEEDRSIGGMESLPAEITLDILSRLPIASLVQSKLVCKPWCNLSHDPRLANMHLSRAAENDPCLIFHSDYPFQNLLCYVSIDSYNETVKTLNIPFRSLMPEFEVVGLCNGFLCLSNSLFGNPQYIYNPFTGEYKELPQASLSPDQMVVFGFGFHPMTEEYKVVRIAYQRYKYYGYRGGSRSGYQKLGVQILTLGTYEWRDIGKPPYLLDSRPSEALVNGSLHWLAKRIVHHRVQCYFIVSFDLASEQFHEIPRPQFGSLSQWNYRLVALKGHLSIVDFCDNENLEIWVMKDYNVSESWTKEFTIKAYVPVGLRQHVDSPIHYGIDRLDRINVRVVCLLNNGEILLEYKGRALVSYNPDTEEFKDLKFHGLPKLFQTVAHVGSLISINAANGIRR